jgi:hypothetical protein
MEPVELIILWRMKTSHSSINNKFVVMDMFSQQFPWMRKKLGIYSIQM